MQPAFGVVLGIWLSGVLLLLWRRLQGKGALPLGLLLGFFIPLTVLVLNLQAGALVRLEDLAIPAPPQYHHVVGTAAGQAGFWLLRSGASPQLVLNFYRRYDYEEGWRLDGEGVLSLRLRRVNQQLDITATPMRTGSTVTLTLGEPR